MIGGNPKKLYFKAYLDYIARSCIYYEDNTGSLTPNIDVQMGRGIILPGH